MKKYGEGGGGDCEIVIYFQIEWVIETKEISSVTNEKHHMLWYFFVFNDMGWEVIVCFVDISGNVVDQHCLV